MSNQNQKISIYGTFLAFLIISSKSTHVTKHFSFVISLCLILYSANIKLQKTQLYKIRQLRGLLGRLLETLLKTSCVNTKCT